jgi:Na+-driven multidrug efflux pump
MILEKYGGDYAIGAFGIISAVQSLFAMIVLGFNQGMQPIAGYNYGAQHFERVKIIFGKTVIAGILVTSIGFLVSQIFPNMIASAFTDDMTMIKLTKTGLHLIFAVYPIVGFQMVTSNLFQSIGYARISIILSLSRQVIFFLPALIILSNFFYLNGAWLATPAADILSTLLAYIILKNQMRKFGKN